MLKTFDQKEKGISTLKLIIIFAIIGIVGFIGFFVVINFVGVGRARLRARDVRVISAMTQMRGAAEMIFFDYGNYDNVDCGVVGEIKNLCQDIAEQVGYPPTIVRSPSPADQYCAYVKLLGRENRMPLFYCIDSEGNFGETTINPATTCGGGTPITYICPQGEVEKPEEDQLPVDG